MSLFSAALVGFLAMPQAAAPSAAVPAGFEVMAALEHEVSSAKVKPGDAVRLTCLHDIASESGTIYIPRGARLLGRVSAVQKLHAPEPAQLSLRVTAAQWKGGSTALDGIVVALVALDPRILQTRGAPAAPELRQPQPHQQVPMTTSGPMTMPSIESDRTMPTAGSVSQPNANIRTQMGTIKVRDRSEGEKSLDALGAEERRAMVVQGRIPRNWELKRVEDPAVGSAITAQGTEVALPKGSQLIFQTR